MSFSIEDGPAVVACACHGMVCATCSYGGCNMVYILLHRQVNGFDSLVIRCVANCRQTSQTLSNAGGVSESWTQLPVPLQVCIRYAPACTLASHRGAPSQNTAEQIEVRCSSRYRYMYPWRPFPSHLPSKSFGPDRLSYNFLISITLTTFAPRGQVSKPNERHPAMASHDPAKQDPHTGCRA